MIIVVNTQQKTVTAERLSFDDVVRLAYPEGTREHNTVVYRRGHGNKSGTLVGGESVSVKDGMLFDVVRT